MREPVPGRVCCKRTRIFALIFVIFRLTNIIAGGAVRFAKNKPPGSFSFATWLVEKSGWLVFRWKRQASVPTSWGRSFAASGFQVATLPGFREFFEVRDAVSLPSKT